MTKKVQKKKVQKKKAPKNKGGRPRESTSKAHLDPKDLKPMNLHPSVQRRTHGPGTRSMDQLRLTAMTIYISDTQGCTLPELAQDPRLGGRVSLNTLRKWSHEDGWTEKRKMAVDAFKEKLGVELQKTLTESLYREVKTLLEFHRQGMHHSSHTPPDKWEGVVKVTMDVNKRLAELAEMMRAGILDGMGRPVPAETGKVTKRMTHDFNPADLREAAKSLTGKQRGAMRARTARTLRKQHERAAMGVHQQEHRSDEHPGGGVSGEE